MTPQEALRAVLDLANRIEALAFEMKAPNAYTPQFVMLANEVRALRAALATEQGPVAQVQVAEDYYPHVVFLDGVDTTDLDQKFLYTAPPQREWHGLSKDELREIFNACEPSERGYVAAMVEAKLKEKNCAPNK